MVSPVSNITNKLLAYDKSFHEHSKSVVEDSNQDSLSEKQDSKLLNKIISRITKKTNLDRKSIIERLAMSPSDKHN
jgi:hypothetical protein